MYTQLTWQTLSPTTGSRQTVDLSSFVTAGSTGVALFFENTNFGNATIGACHPSQTTIRSQSMKNNTGVVAFVGIDGSRQVDVFLSSGVNLSLIGEFDSDAEFLTQDVDKTPVSNDTWTSTAHAETTTAKFAIYNIVKSGDPDVGLTGVRHGDSTNDAQTTNTGTNTWAIVPLNASFESDLYKSAGYQFFLVGFIDSGADAVEAPEDVSTATTGSWQTITPTTTAEYYIVQYRGTHTADADGNQARLSESNTGTNALGKRPAGMHTAIVKDDGAGNIYQNIGSTDYDFFIVGSVTNAAAGPSLDDVGGDDTVVVGATEAITYSSFTSAIETATINDGGTASTSLTVSSAGATSANISLADLDTWVNTKACPFSSTNQTTQQVTVTSTDEDPDETASRAVTFNPPSGYTVIETNSMTWPAPDGSILKGFASQPPANSQIIHPDGLAIDSSGIITTDLTTDQTCYFYNETTEEGSSFQWVIQNSGLGETVHNFTPRGRGGMMWF